MKFPLPRRSPLRAHPCILAVARGATTCTPAPASSRLAIFDWPIAPAPTTKHFRPFSLRKSGNSLSIAFPVDWILVAVRDARPGRRPASAVHINQRGENISPLTDVERSIHRDISKLLHLFWQWPCDLNLQDLSCVSDTDVLAQWIASEARAVPYRPENVALPLRGL